MSATKQAPWREVVLTQRNSSTGSATNHLSCGHQILFRGEAARQAQFAKRRRCKACLAIEQSKGWKVTQ